MAMVSYASLTDTVYLFNAVFSWHFLKTQWEASVKSLTVSKREVGKVSIANRLPEATCVSSSLINSLQPAPGNTSSTVCSNVCAKHVTTEIRNFEGLHQSVEQTDVGPQEKKKMATAPDRVNNLIISLIVLQFIHNPLEVAAGNWT